MINYEYLNATIFKRAHELSPHGVIIINNNKDIIYANKKILQVLGYNHKEITTLNINFILIKKSKKNNLAQLKNKLGNSISILINNIKLLDRKNGISVIYFKINSENEKLNKIKTRDKEKKELLNKINNLKAEFDSLINQCIIKSNQISIVAHDLRAPLGVISTSLSLIEEYSKDKNIPENKKHITKIESKLKEIDESISYLLNKDEEFHKSTIEKISIRTIFKQIVKDHNGILKNGQIVNYKHYGKNTILINKYNLGIIISNLITNSSKYSSEKSQIQLSTTSIQNKVIIEITDQGIGMPQKEKDKIFMKNFRCQNTINIPGNGIGLHTVKSIVDELNGKIYVTSNLNKGTTFRIEIPQ
jgi:PAS domain S-box-containing protein